MEIEIKKSHEGIQQYYMTKVEELQVGLWLTFCNLEFVFLVFLWNLLLGYS